MAPQASAELQAVSHDPRSLAARAPITAWRRASVAVPFTLEFYVEPDSGRAPVHEWIKHELSPFQRRSLGVAMSEILERQGIQVCNGEYGKQLGQGLFEFRLRHGADEIAAMFTSKKPDARDKEEILLRVRLCASPVSFVCTVPVRTNVRRLEGPG